MKISLVLLVLIAATAAVAVPAKEASALEGKWTPQQILELDPKWLREAGLEIPPDKLWSREGGGLLEAAVKIDGCSAGFLTAEGLMITNHHCAYGLVQQHSTTENDLITQGFLARGRNEELAGSGVRATILHRTADVTAQVEAAVPAGADDLARYQAIERKKKELVAACEAQPNRRCQVATYDGGVQYLLLENLEFPDVRLVYIPPSAVGEFGGEVDNYAWPRHTGDFALLRVYADRDGNPAPKADTNVPYRPRHFFPVSPRGIEPDQFVLVAGYSGTTYRSFTEAEMRERAELFFPRQAALYRSWIEIMEAGATGEDARIALADRIKSRGNSEKRALGQGAGIARGNLVEKKQKAEQEVLAWAAKDPKQKAAVDAQKELGRLVDEKRRTWDRDFLLNEMKNGPKILDLALTLSRWSGEKAKPDLERETTYMERNRTKVAEGLRLDQKRLYLPAEEELLADLLTRFAALPEGSRPAAVARLLGGNPEAAAIRSKAQEIVSQTRVSNLDERMKMFDESAEQLRARRDPLLDLALDLDKDLLALKEKDDRYQGAVSRLRPVWRRAVIAHAGKPVDPDGNATLRVSLAHVRGYHPRDAVWMEPRTTVAGLVAKHTGTAPFDVPDPLLAAAPAAPRSRWADPTLKDVPVNFLADADTAGGSSGSPVLNGRGELVGVNFDRVWENVANDFGYNPDVARNTSADVRYLLWVLESTYGEAARPLLREMGVEPPAR